MKWGRRKKPESPPPPSTASPSRLTSLLLRFKKMAAGKGRDTTRGSGSVGNEQLGHASHGRFAGGGRRRAEVYYGDDAFWSLSFRKDAERPERVDDTAGDDVEEPGQVKNFDQMVSGVRRMREVRIKEGASMELKTPPMPGKFAGKKLGSRSRVGADNLPDSSRNRCKDFGCSETVFEETEHLESEAVPEEQRFTGLKSLDVKPERQRKSPHTSRGSPLRKPRPSCRVRINSQSPRSTSGSEMRPICRVRIQSPQLGPGPEKRSKPKSKKRSKEKGIGLERFAVVKSTSDPHRDFRSSMIEMILERRIRKPKELEELLACYLSLNPDEYHEVIIEVFRQIWFEMNRASCCECDDPSGLQTEEDW